MPDLWKRAINTLAYQSLQSELKGVLSGKNVNSARDEFIDIGSRLFKNSEVNAFVKEFYGDVGNAMPVLMASRFYNQIFSRMKNGIDEGKSVIDYSDPSNTVRFIPLPIMDFDEASSVFEQAFDTSQVGSGRSFNKSHCVIDLNPTSSDYTGFTDLTKFPMQFVNVSDVNVDEYKKSKIVLQRVKELSGAVKKGERGIEVTIGGHSSDYSKVTDKNKILYSDSDAIVVGAVDDHATVTLRNGGGCQKNDDFYNIPEDPNDTTGKNKKYYMNKHLFIDPFALTIAQWCYIKGWTTKDDARTGLITDLGFDNFKEIEKSYWKYLLTFEQQGFKDAYERDVG